MIEEEFEAQYNIRRRHPESPQQYARYEANSAAARTALSGRIDLRYGDAEGERLDFFPTTHADAALFLFIHGGYWRAQDKENFAFVATELAPRGITTVVINYELCPSSTLDLVADSQFENARGSRRGWRRRGLGLRASVNSQNPGQCENQRE